MATGEWMPIEAVRIDGEGRSQYLFTGPQSAEVGLRWPGQHEGVRIATLHAGWHSEDTEPVAKVVFHPVLIGRIVNVNGHNYELQPDGKLIPWGTSHHRTRR